MNFRELVGLARRTDPALSALNASDVDVRRIELDSRRVTPGCLFAALPGGKAEGAAFLPDAVRAGAVAVLSNRRLATALPQIIAANPRRALAHLCAALQGRPADRMDVVGVTGTNGKTTTAYLMRHILEHAGRRCGLIGTVQCVIDDETIPAAMTTPEAVDIQSWLARMRNSGRSACAMEVSSHALDQHRVDGMRFRSAVFTNLTQDHLDYHHTMESYFNAKALLFEMLPRNATAVINSDDSWGSRIMARTRARILRFGLNDSADVCARDISMRVDGMRFTLTVRNRGEVEVQSPLTGRYNVYNLLGGIACALSINVNLADIVAAIGGFTGAPGRLERVVGQAANPQPVVFVDYAHTPDALENVCATLREVCKGRKLVTVFGCGGDRDRGKRPLMGAIAERLSDHVIITSDNPRTEQPDAIINEITAGLRSRAIPTTLSASVAASEIQPDRAAAIRLGLRRAGADGVVLIAGKGHEDYQIIGREKQHFDDREQARAALEEFFRGALRV